MTEENSSNKIYIVNDFNEYCNAITEIKKEVDEEAKWISNMSTFPTLWYRGQADKTWDVIPTIQRNNILEKEQVLCHSFYHGASQIMKEHIPKSSYEEWLSIMQHYGLPTRLLDWSYSPLVALYFSLDNENMDADGSITVLVPEFLNYI